MPIAPEPTESNLIGEDPSTGLALDDLYKDYEKPSDIDKPAETVPDQAADQKAAADKAAAEAKTLADQKAADDKVAADADTDGLPPEQAVERLPAAEEPVAPAVEEADPALKAFDEVNTKADESDCDYRTAAYTLAISRVAEACRLKGLFP